MPAKKKVSIFSNFCMIHRRRPIQTNRRRPVPISALADADTLAFAGPPTSAFADSDMSALAGRKTSALAGEKNRKGSKCSAKRSLTLPWIGYADDIVLFLSTVPGLQKCLDLSVKIFTRFALKVNVSKTETQLANMPNTTDQLPPSLIKF